MKLPEVSEHNRITMLFLGSTLFGLMYLGAGNFPVRPIYPAPRTLMDEYVRFIPWTITIYLSQFIFLFVAYWQAKSHKILNQVFYGYLVATLIATIVFMLYPSRVSQTSVNLMHQSQLYTLLFDFLYAIDTPNNCLPSLHTTLALLAAYSFRASTIKFVLAFCWALAIIVSTLTTYQHTILDVLAGVVLFIVAQYICEHKLHYG